MRTEILKGYIPDPLILPKSSQTRRAIAREQWQRNAQSFVICKKSAWHNGWQEYELQTFARLLLSRRNELQLQKQALAPAGRHSLNWPSHWARLREWKGYVKEHRISAPNPAWEFLCDHSAHGPPAACDLIMVVTTDCCLHVDITGAGCCSAEACGHPIKIAGEQGQDGWYRAECSVPNVAPAMFFTNGEGLPPGLVAIDTTWGDFAERLGVLLDEQNWQHSSP
ncbi:hypothetical protein BKA70DRAFT_1243787 [Coprinopsis sp. MPI-PUGE-AT-0042]|nr:hypothetical protein BKA70DRAFT_1243787 [Coprinopsis sp. MPI-PUGE-AT-0042]